MSRSVRDALRGAGVLLDAYIGAFLGCIVALAVLWAVLTRLKD